MLSRADIPNAKLNADIQRITYSGIPMIRLNLGALLLLMSALLAGAPRMAHAAEGYDNCTGFITSLPAVITASGTWCLKQDLATAMTSGNAITINANNVTVDCNDFKLGGLAAGAGTQANGIFAFNRFNMTVRHCNIRGFFVGLLFFGGSSSGGHLVEDNRFDGNTWVGLRVDGDGSIVRRNRVFDTGASTVPGNYPIGLGTTLTVDVMDNTVSGVLALGGSNGNATGIDINSNNGGSISGNKVRSLVPNGTGYATGISSTVSDREIVRDNDLTGDGSAGSTGLRCMDLTTPNGRANGNVINGFVTGISGCSDDGNVVAP